MNNRELARRDLKNIRNDWWLPVKLTSPAPVTVYDKIDGTQDQLLGDVRREAVSYDPETGEYIPAIEPHVAFVEQAKRFIHLGMYKEAFDTIKKAKGAEAGIVKEILCTYVAYAYSLIGQVTEPSYGIEGIDRVMCYGFNWAPPSTILNMLGGTAEIIRLLEESSWRQFSTWSAMTLAFCEQLLMQLPQLMQRSLMTSA